MDTAPTSSSALLNGSMDLAHQSFTIIAPDNTTLVLGLDDVYNYMRYAVFSCTNRGTQIGATIITAIVLLLVTKSEKRRLPIFVLNAMALILNIPRTVLQVVYFTGPLYAPYAIFAFDYSEIPTSAFAQTAAADAMTLLVTICIEVSLVLQVWTVSTMTNRLYRTTILALSIFAASVAVALRFALCVINIHSTLKMLDPQGSLITTFAPAAQISATCSICLVAAIFSSKLGYALLRRRRLGLKQFGPMQIIFIMSCQTMVIPVIFMLLQFFADVPELGSQALTVTAISLPLSSIWAAASVDNRTRPSTAPTGQAGPSKANMSSYGGLSDHKSILSENAEKSASYEES